MILSNEKGTFAIALVPFFKEFFHLLKRNRQKLLKAALIVLFIIFICILLYAVNEYLFTFGFYYLALLGASSTNHRAALVIFSFAMFLAALKVQFDLNENFYKVRVKHCHENLWQLVKYGCYQFTYIWMGYASRIAINYIPRKGNVSLTKFYGPFIKFLWVVKIHTHGIAPFFLAILTSVICWLFAFFVSYIIEYPKNKTF